VNTITLNLLAEEHQAEQAAARDPIKGAVAIGILLVLLAVGVGTYFSIQVGRTAATIDGLQQLWDKISAGSGAGLSAETRASKSVAQEILEIHRARPLFAPQLALVKNVIPETIQLTRFGFTISSEASAPTPVAAEPADELGKKSKAVVAPAKAVVSRPRTVERVRMQLEGKATCSRPEMEVDEFLKALRVDPAVQEQIQQIQLLSIARLPAGADALPAVAFVIECQYKELK